MQQRAVLLAQREGDLGRDSGQISDSEYRALVAIFERDIELVKGFGPE